MEHSTLELLNLLGASVAHAQNTATSAGFVPISEGFAQLIGGTGNDLNFSGDFGQVVNGIYKLSIRIAGAVAVAMFVWGGIQYMIQPFGVSEGGIGEAKGRMQNAILGLLMLLATWIIFNQINPDILNLKINAAPLQALKTEQPNTTNNSQQDLSASRDLNIDSSTITRDQKSQKCFADSNVCDPGCNGITKEQCCSTTSVEVSCN